jgi:hypothetical protein
LVSMLTLGEGLEVSLKMGTALRCKCARYFRSCIAVSVMSKESGVDEAPLWTFFRGDG